MSILVKVILVLHAAFSLSSFKSSPMLSMLLSVEELESLVVPYCHVFENRLNFLTFVNSVVPQLLLIIIKPWFQSFAISSSPTSIPSLSLPHLPQFFFSSRTEHVLKHPSKFKFMKLYFQRAIVRMKRVPNKRVVSILLRRCNLSKADFRLRYAQCFCHISLYRSSKLMILDALERRFEGASEY
jgi:hypothetical protein